VEVDGVKLKAFTAEEYAEIVKLEDDYLWFFGNWPKLQLALEKSKGETLVGQERLHLCREDLGLVRTDREILRKAWKEERRLRLDERNATKAREWIPWGLVIVQSIGFGVVGIYAASQ